MDFGGGESPSRAGVRHISDGGGKLGGCHDFTK